MRKRQRNVFFIAGAATIALGASTRISYSISEKLVELALDRKMPKVLENGKDKISGSKKNEEYIKRVNVETEKLKNSTMEKVEIISNDGLKLVGHWKACENPKRIIIAMHGWRSSWCKDFGMIAEFWHENDCEVLYVEQRAQGESEGNYMGFGLMERYDCLEWIKWVNEKTGATLPIYLGGVSMGATTVLMTAGFELPDNVKGIVADCGFTSPHEIWKYVVEKNLHIPYRIHESAINYLCRMKIHTGDQGYSTVRAMKSCKVPILFIHGTDDKFVPIEMTYENYKSCNAEKRIVIVPGAGHGMSYYVNQKEYEKALTDFWNKCEN